MNHARPIPRPAAPPRSYALVRLALAAFAASSFALAAPAHAATPPAARGPIATVGDRTVEALDIQRAAVILADDPLRRQNPTLWRRMLADRCVDRELLSMEAARQGLMKDPSVRRKVADREYLHLYQTVYEKVLAPRFKPTPAQLESLTATGLYRSMDLHYILVRDTAARARRTEAERLVERLRGGLRFDSTAAIVSAHPSRGNGGHFGPVLVRDLEPMAHAELRTAKVGDVLGPYTGMYGHEIYKVGGFEPLPEDSLQRLLRVERERNADRDYGAELRAKYRFAVDTAMVNPLLFALGSETPDSILASLGPDGTRPRSGVRPALGVIARVSGDSITVRDLLEGTHLPVGGNGRVRVRNEEAVRELAGQATFRRLLVRDARDRGLTDDPVVARELRLIREEAAVLAMVERARPADPSDAALRAWFDAHASRYRRPPARRVRVAAFASPESALAALRDWNGADIKDSSLASRGLTEQPRATARTILPRRAAVLTLFENDVDPLSRAVRNLDVGRISPVVGTGSSYVVAQVLTTEVTRPYTLEEVIDRARRDWREEKENEWVVSQLERMRATTPVRIIPARLEAVKLGAAAKSSRGTVRR